MRNHTPKSSAGYQSGVTKGDGASIGRGVQVAEREPWAPAPDREPKDERERRGRAAFYAARERLSGVYPRHPTWSQMTPIQQEAWCDAAEAARREP